MKERLKIIVFIILLASISAGLISGVNNFTGPRVLRNRELKLKSAVLDAFSVTYSEAEIENKFEENISLRRKNDTIFYENTAGEVGFVFDGPGLWGNITGVIRVTPDFKVIKGIKIIRQEETPGLGGRIAENEFLRRFTNKVFSPKIRITKSGEAKTESEIDGISGATMSCRAFEDIINANVEKYSK